MKLSEWQRYAALNESESDDIERMALLICAINKLPGEVVDKMPLGIFSAYGLLAGRLMERQRRRRWWYIHRKFQADAFKITFGQFIEIQYWLERFGPIFGLHLIAASLSKDKGEHIEKAGKILNGSARSVLPDLLVFLESFAELLKAYDGLFDMPPEDLSEDIKRPTADHPFLRQYGWIHSAKRVAEHEGVKLDEVFGLPIIQALNDLAYLKSEQEYLKELYK